MKQIYVDDETHQELKARAAFASCKMGEYVGRLLGLGDSGVGKAESPSCETETTPPPIEPQTFGTHNALDCCKNPDCPACHGKGYITPVDVVEPAPAVPPGDNNEV